MHRMPMALPAGGGAAERLPGWATRCLPVSTSTRYGSRRGPQDINSKNSKQCVWLFSTTNKPEKNGLECKYWKPPCFSPAEVSVQCYYLSFVGGGEISFCYIVICVSLPQVSEEEVVFLFPPCSLWAIICGLCFLLRPCSVSASLVRTVMMNVAVIYKAGDMDSKGWSLFEANHMLSMQMCLFPFFNPALILPQIPTIACKRKEAKERRREVAHYSLSSF